MKRTVQGLCIVLGSIVATTTVLAAALAWGPHYCDPVFPNVIGCAFGSYESLSGGMVAASAALFAGWLAWSGVQVQIAAEERRASAERIEVEKILQDDLDTFAEALGVVWKILESLQRKEPDAPKIDPKEPEIKQKLEGVMFGIEEITKDAWLNSSRQMVAALGWRRRRDYEELFGGLEQLRRIRDMDFDLYDALSAVRSVSVDFELLRPETARYFKGRFRRAGKAYTLGYAIEVQAGVANSGRASFEPGVD